MAAASGSSRKRDVNGDLVGTPAWRAAQEHLPAGMDARDRATLQHAFFVLEAISQNTIVMPPNVDTSQMKEPLKVRVCMQLTPSDDGGDRLFYEVVAQFAPHVLISLSELNRLRDVHDEYMSDPVVRMNIDAHRVDIHFTLHSQTQRPPSTVVRRQVVTIYREHDIGGGGGGGRYPRPSTGAPPFSPPGSILGDLFGRVIGSPRK
jgi:hypothetical protein